MNSENSKTSDTQRLRLNLTNKMDLEKGDKHFQLSKLSMYFRWKNIKKSCRNNKFKYQEQYGMKTLNFLVDLVLYPALKSVLIIPDHRKASNIDC